MTSLRIGSSGDDVCRVQSMLNLIGEKLTVDGSYGSKTRDAIERFQQKNSISIDGIVGHDTMTLLERVSSKTTPLPAADVIEIPDETGPDSNIADPDPILIGIDRSNYLDKSQYVVEDVEKLAIVLHNTEGASALSTIESWSHDSQRVAVAYVIERDGTIYEVFPPGMWAWHLGSSSMLGISQEDAEHYNSSTIGIELANEGPLKRGRSSAYYCFDSTNPKNTYKGRPWGMGFDDMVTEQWRDGKYWAAYPSPQMVALGKLVDGLCKKYNIPRVCTGNLDYNVETLKFSGVYCHANVRKDKMDLHPGFDWNTLNLSYPKVL